MKEMGITEEMLQRMMKKSEEKVRAGRFITHKEVMNRLQARHRE